MAVKSYPSIGDFKPPQKDLPTKPKESYTVSVIDDGGRINVIRNNESGGRTIIGFYTNDTPFTSTSSASNAEIKYFSIRKTYITTTYAAPTVTAGGGDPNKVLNTNFAIAPTAALSTNANANASGPTELDIKNAVTTASSIDGSKLELKVGTTYGRSSYDNLFYPQDLTSNKQDRIKFTMFKYAAATINPKLGEKTISRQIKDSIGSVTLPIQPSISDSNSVDWSGGTLNALQAFGAGASLSLMNSPGLFQLGENVGKIMGEVMLRLREDKTYGEAFKIYAAQEAVGAQNLLSRASGAILNPNLELLFNGPSLRPFAFTFRLSARDNTEAIQIKKIIRFFKQGMSVKTTSSNVFLKSPHVFSINYQTFDSDGSPVNNHPSINMIKKCALLSCDVDYTPDGTYMTYNNEDRTMTSYQLSLRFSELDPVYDSDYTNIDNDKDILIGY